MSDWESIYRNMAASLQPRPTCTMVCMFTALGGMTHTDCPRLLAHDFRAVLLDSSHTCHTFNACTQAGACNIRHDKAEHISHEVCLRDFKLQSVLLQLCKDCVQSERNIQGSSRMWPIVAPAADSKGRSLYHNRRNELSNRTW